MLKQKEEGTKEPPTRSGVLAHREEVAAKGEEPRVAAPPAPKQVGSPEPVEIKIALVAFGSRGDVQPVVALALRLKELGVHVRMLVNGDEHADFVRSFGLNTYSYPQVWRFDAHALMNGEEEKDMSYVDSCPQYRAILGDVRFFEPDLLVYSPYNRLEAWLAEEQLQVCTVQFCFHLGDDSAKVEAPKIVEDIVRRKQPLAWQLGAGILSTLDVDKAEALIGVRRPVLYAASPEVAKRSPAWTAPTEDAGVHLTGYWVLDRELQMDAKARCSVHFGGPQASELERFLTSHERVVYIGWGYMFVKSKEFMAQLAVRALMIAGRSGIVLGSYHSLGRDMLTGAPDEALLKEHADKHVLWLQWAPHEWLMPRCDVVVHHGGCGTTAASLRAGRPTVVTPVSYDQRYWAERVEKLGVGVATEQLAKTGAQSIASAVRECSREPVRRRAEELAVRLRAEDGARNAAALLATYVEEEVRSGNWKRSALGPAPDPQQQQQLDVRADRRPRLLDARTDLALYRPADASSWKSLERPENAVDGLGWTRWTSKYSDFQWLAVDLGAVRALSTVEVKWEAAYARDYTIEGSADKQTWTRLATAQGKRGWVVSRLDAGAAARWVRLSCGKMATSFGFSIWELRIFA